MTIKETIVFETEQKFFEFYETLGFDDETDFGFLEEKQSDFDSEKNSITITFYVERIKDGKKFSGSFTRASHGKESVRDLTLKEVPKPIIFPQKTWREIEQEAMELFEDNFDNEKFKDWLYENFEPPKRKK